MGKFLSIIAACALACISAACNSAGCTDNGSAIPLAGFYSSASAEAISLNSLAIFGLGAPDDSALCRPGTAISQIYLPMRPDTDMTAWKIEYKDCLLDFEENYDTITLNYESIPYFASEDCGAMFYYRLRSLSHTMHLMDSVTVTDSMFTNADRETIQIYFRTAGEDGEQ